MVHQPEETGKNDSEGGKIGPRDRRRTFQQDSDSQKAVKSQERCEVLKPQIDQRPSVRCGLLKRRNKDLARRLGVTASGVGLISHAPNLPQRRLSSPGAT